MLTFYDFPNRIKNVKNKIEFLSSYKFSISMENSEGDGYVTEKIIESFIAGTIPIYYGDYMIDEYINPKAYILIKYHKIHAIYNFFLNLFFNYI